MKDDFASTIDSGILPWINIENMEYTQLSEMNKLTFLELINSRKKYIYELFASKYSIPYAKLMTLKIINLYIAKYHYLNRHSTIASRPIQLMVDPANACQLACPGCVHTSNPTVSTEARLFWPPGMLPYELFEHFLRQYGPFAFGAVLYNYGEPLLNPLTPQFISLSKQYLLYTALSTNLSLPNINVDALVTSGLNHMIISIDGVTQSTYEQYRRGGKLDLVFENLQKIVDAKKRLDLKLPYLVWQFLTFEHNAHEVDAAIELAGSIGVDAIQILTPFNVAWDDPSIKAVTSLKEGYHHFTPWQSRLNSTFETKSRLASGPEIDSLLNENLMVKMSAIGDVDEASRTEDLHCGWLHKNISIDGLGRILPCCCSPSKKRNLIFGNIQDNDNDYWNSDEFVSSRLALINKQTNKPFPSEKATYCRDCTAISQPPLNLWWVSEYLQAIDPNNVIPAGIASWLTDWN